MPYCPDCRSEYLSEITECAACGVPLVVELSGPSFMGSQEHAAYFSGQALELVTLGSLDMCREIRELLEKDGVPARIVASDEIAETPVHMRMRLEIVAADLPRAQQVMAGHWREVVAAEGADADQAKSAALDSGGETECPGCAARFIPLSTSGAECPECGLFLGVSTPAG